MVWALASSRMAVGSGMGSRVGASLTAVTVTVKVREKVLTSYARFTAFVRDEYAPKGRTEPGVWSLPDGPARYAALVKSSTTTDLTPEQIHQLGLSEVARID